MKKIILSQVLLILILTGCGSQQDTNGQNTITLRLADHWPVEHTHSQGSQYFAERVEELSDGRIEIEHYPAEQLGNPSDMLTIASQGTAEITVVGNPVFAGELPLSTVMMLPNYSTAVEGTEIFNELIKNVPELDEEFAKYETKLLFGITTSSNNVGTVNTPVRSPEDLNGLQLSVAGGMFNEIAEKYGINAVTIAGSERYESTERNIVEGNTLALPSVKSYSLHEIQNYYTDGLRLGASPLSYVINLKVWDEMPEDLQEILLQAGEEAGIYVSELWDNDVQAIKDEFEQEGLDIYTIKPEEREEWDAPLEGIEQEWINDMNDQGLPGQIVFDEFERISKEVTE